MILHLAFLKICRIYFSNPTVQSNRSSKFDTCYPEFFLFHRV